MDAAFWSYMSLYVCSPLVHVPCWSSSCLISLVLLDRMGGGGGAITSKFTDAVSNGENFRYQWKVVVVASTQRDASR